MSRSSGVSALTLLRKKGTPSIAEKGRTLGDCGGKKREAIIKYEVKQTHLQRTCSRKWIVYEIRTNICDNKGMLIRKINVYNPEGDMLEKGICQENH